MGKPLRVLLVEDSEADAKLLLRELRHGGYAPVFERVDTPEAMSEAVAEQDWDIVLSDYVMPSFGGLAALELLNAKGIDIPFIIVSGKIGEEIAVQAMKAGADDYILKDKLTRLVPAIERGLRDAEVRRGRRKAEQERDRLMEQLRTVNEQLVLSSLRIRQESSEVEAVITALAEATVVFGSNGEIIQLNPPAADLLGYSSTGPNKPILEQLALIRMETEDGRPYPLADCPPARALRGETVRGAVAAIRRASGAKPTWVSIGAAPILVSDGKSQGGVAIFTDVTKLCECHTDKSLTE